MFRSGHVIIRTGFKVGRGMTSTAPRPLIFVGPTPSSPSPSSSPFPLFSPMTVRWFAAGKKGGGGGKKGGEKEVPAAASGASDFSLDEVSLTSFSAYMYPGCLGFFLLNPRHLIHLMFFSFFVTNKQVKASMQPCFDRLKSDFEKIEGGRVTTAMLEGIMCQAYGEPARLADMAATHVQSPTELLVTVHDRELLGAAEIALNDYASTTGTCAVVKNGPSFILKYQKPTAEFRQEQVKKAQAVAELCRTAIRNKRTKAVADLKKVEKLIFFLLLFSSLFSSSSFFFFSFLLLFCSFANFSCCVFLFFFFFAFFFFFSALLCFSLLGRPSCRKMTCLPCKKAWTT